MLIEFDSSQLQDEKINEQIRVMNAGAAFIRARESEFRRQKSKLEKIQDKITKTKIYAPADGLVVYATSAKANWRGNGSRWLKDREFASGRS